MVNVYVGPTQQRFHLHRALLSDRSDYFKAALDRSIGYKEATSAEIALVDADVDAFELFVSWLYGGHGLELRFYVKSETLWSLLVLADRLVLDDLFNSTMDSIRDLLRLKFITFEHPLDLEDIQFVYQIFACGKAQFLMCLLAVLQTSDDNKSKTLSESKTVEEAASELEDFAAGFPRLLEWYKHARTAITESILLNRDYDGVFHNHQDRSRCFPESLYEDDDDIAKELRLAWDCFCDWHDDLQTEESWRLEN